MLRFKKMLYLFRMGVGWDQMTLQLFKLRKTHARAVILIQHSIFAYLLTQLPKSEVSEVVLIKA